MCDYLSFFIWNDYIHAWYGHVIKYRLPEIKWWRTASDTKALFLAYGQVSKNERVVAAKFKIKTTTFRACPKRWNQDLDFQGHMSSFYLCSVSEGETWLFILLISVEMLTIIILQLTFSYFSLRFWWEHSPGCRMNGWVSFIVWN